MLEKLEFEEEIEPHGMPSNIYKTMDNSVFMKQVSISVTVLRSGLGVFKHNLPTKPLECVFSACIPCAMGWSVRTHIFDPGGACLCGENPLYNESCISCLACRYLQAML